MMKASQLYGIHVISLELHHYIIRLMKVSNMGANFLHLHSIITSAAEQIQYWKYGIWEIAANPYSIVKI